MDGRPWRDNDGRILSSDILITPLDQFTNEVGYDPEWKEKADSRMVWVGPLDACVSLDKNSHTHKEGKHDRNLLDGREDALEESASLQAASVRPESIGCAPDFSYAGYQRGRRAFEDAQRARRRQGHSGVFLRHEACRETLTVQ